MPRDYYEILGVERSADSVTIKKAYRSLAIKFHPDKNPGDKEAEDKFKECAEAYQILSDPNKKARYDQFGHAGVNGGPGGFGGGGFGDVNDIFSAFGDIFGDFFGGAGPRTRRGSRTSRGSDLRYVVDIEMKEVLTGAEKQIEFETEDTCKTCTGTGAKKGSSPETCRNCGGAGQVVRQQGFFAVATTCGSCQGQGQVIKDPCGDCQGSGRQASKRKISVNIPKGVSTGTQLRLSNEGEGGFRGGPRGDLYVQVNVVDHPNFEREGQNLHRRFKISYLQALLGAELEVETLDGTADLVVEPGTQPTDILSVKGEGLPSLRNPRRGDLFVHISIDIPKKLSKNEEKALRDLAEEKGESVLGKSGIFGRKK